MTPSKQISRLLQAWVGVAGFTCGGGTSDAITATLTTVLATASDAGGAVPLQPGNRTTEGVNVTTGTNVTDVYVAGTGQRMVDGNGNDVYGKITNSGSVYTLSYFSSNAGTESAYAMAANAVINFDVPYVFSFADLPFTALTSEVSRHIAPDLASFGLRLVTDVLTVTAANVLSASSRTPSGVVDMLVVNKLVYTSFGSAPDYTCSGTAVAWSQANAGFALAPGDDVKRIYSY